MNASFRLVFQCHYLPAGVPAASSIVELPGYSWQGTPEQFCQSCVRYGDDDDGGVGCVSVVCSIAVAEVAVVVVVAAAVVVVAVLVCVTSMALVVFWRKAVWKLIQKAVAA